MLVFFIAGEKRRAYPAAIEKPRQPSDKLSAFAAGVALCCWKMHLRLLELRVVQLGVEAALGEQLVVRALLDDIAVADY